MRRSDVTETNTQFQLYSEALDWFEFTQDEVTNMMYKAKQMSVQEGIRLYGKEGKNSAMKEILNLTEKNDCFGEIEYESIQSHRKDKALPVLVFMITKRNVSLKTRGCANGSSQKLYTKKNEVSSPTSDFYAFKYRCAVIAKEKRDAATVDLPGYFLQTDQDQDLLLKLTGSVTLLTIESN